MGFLEMQTPIDGERRLVRLFTDEGDISYLAKYCVLCNEWMREEGGIMRVKGVPMGFICALHAED